MDSILPDEHYMSRAIDIARNGKGLVSPNPLVGCVIVHDGKIIGEGWHQRYGQAHAEVNAVNAVEDKHLLQRSTAFVTLEPCAHFGKTPPCADLLIQVGIKRVVIANRDPFSLVNGRGIDKLKQAGVDVVTGVCEQDGRAMNIRFFTFVEQERPYIMLKWAQTADGFIARKNFDAKWISNEASRLLVHQWRAEEDAILVGAGTALHDNPKLNVRDWKGRNPVRIIIDPELRVPRTHHVFDDSQPTIIFNRTTQEKYSEALEFALLPESDQGLLKLLWEKRIQSVMVEGGTATLQRFIDQGLWDEARVFVSDGQFGEGISAPVLHNSKLVSVTKVMDDTLSIYRPSVGTNKSYFI